MKASFLGLITAAAILTTSALAGINGGARQLAKTEVLLLIGPSELARTGEKHGSVLGQKIPAQYLAGTDSTSTIFVFGVVRADGSLFVSRIQAGATYVPGATPVLLTGVLEHIDLSTGRAVVSGVPVDLVTLLVNEANAIAVGKVVRVTGIQPSIGGVILATRLESGTGTGLEDPTTSGINGGAVKNVTPSLDAVTLGINGGAVR